MNIITTIGFIGATIILYAFYLNQTHQISRDSKKYDWLNLVGSGLLMTYAFLLSSMPFVVLNSIWFLVSLRDIIAKK